MVHSSILLLLLIVIITLQHTLCDGKYVRRQTSMRSETIAASSLLQKTEEKKEERLGGVNAAKKLANRVKEKAKEKARALEEKLKKARDQQATSIPSAVGVAIKTIEAWLLADETAIAKAFSSETPSTTKNPEKLSDPKQILQGRLDKIDVWANYSEMYADLAGNTRIEVLRKRCPNGFAPFETELLSLFE